VTKGAFVARGAGEAPAGVAQGCPLFFISPMIGGQGVDKNSFNTLITAPPPITIVLVWKNLCLKLYLKN
jgi:hypothetical protein